jgi:hypothetical protein
MDYEYQNLILNLNAYEIQNQHGIPRLVLLYLIEFSKTKKKKYLTVVGPLQMPRDSEKIHHFNESDADSEHVTLFEKYRGQRNGLIDSCLFET